MVAKQISGIYRSLLSAESLCIIRPEKKMPREILVVLFHFLKTATTVRQRLFGQDCEQEGGNLDEIVHPNAVAILNEIIGNHIATIEAKPMIQYTPSIFFSDLFVMPSICIGSLAQSFRLDAQGFGDSLYRVSSRLTSLADFYPGNGLLIDTRFFRQLLLTESPFLAPML